MPLMYRVRVRCSSVRVQCSSVRVRCGSVRVRCSSVRVRGVAQLVVHRLAVRQALVRFSARHLMEVLLFLSEEAMRIQEEGPRQMLRMNECMIVLCE
jgi:hypothetical protein